MNETGFNIAVVGAGMASAPHLASLLALQDRATVRHVVARSEERAGAFARQLPHARVTLDLDTALADEHVDGVLLLTPPNTHLELGARIAAAGKHLLVEKPIDVTTSARANWSRYAKHAASSRRRCCNIARATHRASCVNCSTQARSARFTARASPCRGGVRSRITTKRDAARWPATAAAC
ncbi:Gfo/Idh/MocA family oxidoreductase [Paraburkholderia kirstenboschensis]|uniref:Gfo/Idh/MocA family oxidoreductase n=1 Tax=Paraburkholderia kirstenboschensis TaxID=1245436 RepID=UPI000A9F9462|nr:Gfo/Idh/MocA family oxidoreductase [Paraburkholderia kirstenboschensis]